MLQKKEKRKRDTISHLRATTEVIPNINADTILGDVKEWKRAYDEMMSKEGDIDRKEIFEMLFMEMAVVRKRKNKFGDARGHDWSPLMIQFSVYV